MSKSIGSVLLVSHFGSTVGYAWDFIGRLYARVADHMDTHGIPTFVAYPSIPAPPAALAGSAARPVVLDASFNSKDSVRATVDLIRRENIRVVQFISHPAWSLNYLRLRRAGCRRIIVYDHTSGEFTRPVGFKRAAKWMIGRTPGIVADVVLGVSEYVSRRQVEVGLIPPERVKTLWNGLPTVTTQGAYERVRALLGFRGGCPLVVCNCRATPEKGVQHLLRAFNRVHQHGMANNVLPVLVYLGDGPYMNELRSQRETLPAKDDISFGGYRPDAREIIEGADLCVVPSVWQDAFPLAVLEAMARGRPIIATRVGGIPEMVEHNVTGLLVPPADEDALAKAMSDLLKDPAKAARFGEAARQRVAERFTPEQQFARLTALIEDGFGKRCEALAGR
jgi:glycosyltransferase involved in cell wall biosynthesis